MLLERLVTRETRGYSRDGRLLERTGARYAFPEVVKYLSMHTGCVVLRNVRSCHAPAHMSERSRGPEVVQNRQHLAGAIVVSLSLTPSQI